MAQLFPFRALMPPPVLAAEVAACPYDVIEREEARARLTAEPGSFLRISRADADLPDEIDAHDPRVYERAADTYRQWRREGRLAPDQSARFYVYSAEQDGCRQLGLAATIAVDDYDDDTVKKHEQTKPAKEQDRLDHALALQAHSGLVLLLCRDHEGLTRRLEEVATGMPLFDVQQDDARHRLWPLPAAWNEALQEIGRDVGALYIADGHHRAKVGSRVRETCRDINPEHDGSELYNRFLGVIFPASQLRILPYNRLVHDWGESDPEAFRAGLQAAFQITPLEQFTEPAPEQAAVYFAAQWLLLEPRGEVPADDPVESLMAQITQERLLEPLLGIADPRRDPRLSFVGGVHGHEGLAERVDRGDGVLAIALPAVRVEQLMAVADAGRMMPPKSTWFEPKLRDGLLVYDFDVGP